MKILISVVVMLCCTLLHTNAQQNFNVYGFSGKDTLHLGTVTPDKKGILQLNLKEYKGAITITPVSEEYNDIVTHLEQIRLINSKELFDAARAYVADTLPFNTLYNSGKWQEYIQQWVGFYANTTRTPDDFAKAFVPEAKKVLDRTVFLYPKIASYLTRDLIDFFEQYGLDLAAQNIAAYSMGLDMGDNEPSEITARLLTASKLINSPAPAIPEVENLSSVILLFYETGCHNCDAQIAEFKNHYKDIQSKGYRVITISSDNDEAIYKAASGSFPWPEKLCDFESFEGKNFKNYGVASTPTIYQIDEKGIVVGRYAKLSDITF